MWQVALAVAGAWCVAIGAAAQEQPATVVRSGGRLSLLVGLIRSPRWLAGAIVTAAGMVMHLIALTNAPLTVIQPLGISGLLVAVWIAARWRRRRVTGRELLGGAAVTLGLAGLVITLPGPGVDSAPVNDTGLLLLGAVVLPLAAGLLWAAPRLRPAVRAAALAAAAGTCFGVTAALVRVVSTAVRTDPSAWWHWHSLLALAVLSVGAVALPQAYRAGHFALSYAVLLIADPLTAASVGVFLVGEPLPTEPIPAATAALCALLTAVGAIALSRSAPAAGPPEPDEPMKENRDASLRTVNARI